MEKNSERQLVKIIKEVCAKNGVRFRAAYSYDWILELEIEGKLFYIIGFKFPNNSASAADLCDDKSGLYEVLRANGFPAVEHHFFISPNSTHYAETDGNGKLQQLLKIHKKLVLKSNRGTGGNNCFIVSDAAELNRVTDALYQKTYAIAASPYYKIEDEYRIIVLNGAVELVYCKKRASVTGDGVKSVGALVSEKYPDKKIEIDSGIDLHKVLSAGETMHLTWKHNIGKGACAELVPPSELYNTLSQLALRVANKIGITFASVDIVNIGGELKVLEINSGVMMEGFAAQSAEFYGIASSVYEKAVMSLFSDSGKAAKPRRKERKAGAPALVLPLLNKAATETGAEMLMDGEFSNYCIYTFDNGKNFVARDIPFSINMAGSVSLAANKKASAYFLSQMGYNCPETEFILCGEREETLSKLKAAVQKFGYPVILKPNNLSQGQFVFKAENEAELADAFRQLYDNCKGFLAQEYCRGNDYRVVVLGGKIIQAYQRIPLAVTGDGKKTVRTMLEEKRDLYRREERDTDLNIDDARIYAALAKKGYSKETVLKKGETVFLQDISNLSLGGTSADVMDTISPFYKTLCAEIAKKLNLNMCGVDIICGDISQSGGDYTIIEVNSSPGLDNYMYNHISVEKQKAYVEGLYKEIFDVLNRQ